MSYNQFLGIFPKIKYNVRNLPYGQTENVTDLFFRIGVVQNTLQNASSYYIYSINEGETPDILAAKVYNDPGAFWMILYANNMFDPQFDWPLDPDAFTKYVIEKYKPQTLTASIDRVVVNNPGTGYANGYLDIFDGHGYGANVAITVDFDGSITSANVIYGGTGYQIHDEVNYDASSLGGTGAEFTIYLKDPSDQDVLAYVQETPHHYEKVITRINSAHDEQVEQTRFWVTKDQLSNGNIYLNEVDGTFELGEYANTENAGFSGTVVQWTPTGYNDDTGLANGWLKLVNTGGNFIEYVPIVGANSGATGNIIHTAFTSVPFDYYNNLPETQSYEAINMGNYTMTEIYKRFTISIWDYESELNEQKRYIKIIKPAYYDRIQNELKDLIKNYNSNVALPVYSYKRRLF